MQNEEIIKTLAARAQENQRLKEIMQIVAKGNANPEELAFFQHHIDDITQMVNNRRRKEEEDKRRAAAATAAAASAAASTTPMRSSPATTGPSSRVYTPTAGNTAPVSNSSTAAVNSTHSVPKPAVTAPYTTSPAVQAPAHSYTPQPVRPPSAPSVAKAPYAVSIGTPRPPTPSTPYYAQPRPTPPPYTPARHNASSTPTATTNTYRKPAGVPLHVLIEFASNPNDRFLFPVHSILQYTSNFSAVLASFLIIKKGHQAADPTAFADQEAEYYQPVTVKIAVKNLKEAEMLGFLARLVKPQEEVRKYMEDVFKRAKRVEDSYLAMRLPWKEGIGENGEKVEA